MKQRFEMQVRTDRADEGRQPARGCSGRCGPAPAQTGFALLTALMISLIVFALISAWLTMIIVRGRKASLDQDRKQAAYTANSGLARALWYLSGNGEHTMDVSQNQTWNEDLFGSDGACHISTSREFGYFKVDCTGKSHNASATASTRFGLDADSLFPEALVLSDPRGIILKPGSTVNGDIKCPAPPQNTGGSWHGAYRILDRFPTPDIESFEQAAGAYQEILAEPRRADLELFSPQVFDETHALPAQHTIYINDDVLITGHRDAAVIFSGPRTIVSTADIQVSGTATLQDITLIASGRITLLDQARAYQCVLYTAREAVLSDESVFKGKIYSQMDITVRQRAAVRQGSQLVSFGNPDGKITIDGSTDVWGVVMLFAGEIGKSGVFVGPGAVVNGMVLSANRAAIEGTVNGAVIAGTLYDASADTLQNCCLTGTVNRGTGPAISLPVGFAAHPKMSWLRRID